MRGASTRARPLPSHLPLWGRPRIRRTTGAKPTTPTPPAPGGFPGFNLAQLSATTRPSVEMTAEKALQKRKRESLICHDGDVRRVRNPYRRPNLKTETSFSAPSYWTADKASLLSDRV